MSCPFSPKLSELAIDFAREQPTRLETRREIRAVDDGEAKAAGGHGVLGRRPVLILASLVVLVSLDTPKGPKNQGGARIESQVNAFKPRGATWTAAPEAYH